jgi:hypothetical protein
LYQTVLSEHIETNAYELCPQCFKPITRSWKTILIEPYEDLDRAILTKERECNNCNYTEQEQVEQLKSIICHSSKDNSCDLCINKCNGGCK